MDSDVLVEELIQDGRLLVQGLDSKGLPPDVALWFFYADVGQWRLLLGSTGLSEMKPPLAYKSIAEVLAGIPTARLTISDIKVLDKAEPLVQTLRRIAGTAPAPSIGSIRMTSNYFNNVFIQDALIYRLAPEATKKPR